MVERKTLLGRLAELSEGGAVPMHMPGHKRNVKGGAFLEALGGKYDISEIRGFDDLHDPQGVLKEAMAQAAALWKSQESFFLVNGSTGGILAAVRAAARVTGKDKIIMARNCHKSVFNAAELCRLEPVYMPPPRVDNFGFCSSISPRSVELALRDNPGAPVILTSPTYEGVVSNIAEIAVVCHLRGSPLIVDEAHGAHLDLSPHFIGGGVRSGADLVVQSVHKTLTGLTQTAILHLNSKLITPEQVRGELAVFQSSSPSYLLMASIDGTVDLLEKRGRELFEGWKKRLDRFDKRVADLKNLKIPGHGGYFECQSKQHPAGYRRFDLGSGEVFGYDRSKIIISCEGTSITGVQLSDRLYEDFGVECEMAAGGYCVAMTSLLDEVGSLDRLAEAVCALDADIHRTVPRIPLRMPKIPPQRMRLWQAQSVPARAVSIRDARGCVAAEYVYAYPPGIPLAVPGEELTEELISSLIRQREVGVSLKSTSGEMPQKIRVLR